MRVDTEISFQFVSDLHLEFPDAADYVEDIPKTADNMLLLGDIGNPYQQSYRQLLDQLSSSYEQIYVVAGNHEYYRGSYQETNLKINEICGQYDNVTFLNKTAVELPGCHYTLLGCTLWTHVPEQHHGLMSWMVNDYKVIYNSPEMDTKIKVADTNRWHDEEVQWLEKNIRRAKRRHREVIIATHHAPTWDKAIDPKELDGGDIYGHISGSHLERLFGKPVKAWLFGHTHYNCDFFSKETRVVSNQRGYRDEGKGFDGEKKITFSPK